MLKPILKSLSIICFMLTICAAFTFNISAAEPSDASDMIADGSYYKLSNKSADGYMTYRDGKLVVAEDDTADSIIEINKTRSGEYTLRFISAKENGYLSASVEEMGVALVLSGDAEDDASRFSIEYNGERYEISPSVSAENGDVLSAFKEESGWGLCVGEKSDDLSEWKISEFKPESMMISQTSIETKPYISYSDLRVVVSPSYLCDYIEWDSSDRKVLIVDDTGKFCSLAEGDSTVTASIGSYSVKCKVNVSYDNEYAWFSQNNVETGGWNGKSLYNIYFRGGGYRKRFAFTGSTKNNDWLSEGCALCSIAQVLNNMGARLTDGYDVRSGIEGNLLADPYTVALANTDNHGATSFSETLWGDPIYTRQNAIAARFNKDGAAVTVSIKYSVTKKTIKEALDKSPWGVVVRFENSAYGIHYITFNKCINPDAENWRDYKFLVSDPAAMTGESADNVLFEQSYSYKRLYYRFSQAQIMQIWDYER